MKIAFFGSSSFSVIVLSEILKSEHSISLIVTTPEQKKGRGQIISPSEIKTFSTDHQLPLIEPEKLSNPATIEAIIKAEPDFLVVASYGKLIPSAILKIPKIAALNVHPSLLPRYRGASPIQAAILAGDEQTGISIAELIDRLDAGDVFEQAQTKIDADETAQELGRRLAFMGAQLLVNVIARFQNNTVSRIPQEESASTYATKITKESGLIDWNMPSIQIHCQVRAYFPWPSAFTFFRGKRIKIIQTRALSVNAASLTQSTIPGEISQTANGKIFAQTSSELLELLQVHPEGSRAMSAVDFIRGQRLQPKEKFTRS